MVTARLTGVLLALIFSIMIAPMMVPFFVSMDRYYVLSSVFVDNAAQGESPAMIVDRTIQRDFRGWFEVEILRADGGEFQAYWACGSHRSQERTYRKEAHLPDDLNLNWWMDIPPNRECDLPLGQYRISTTIYARSYFGAVLSTSRDSPVFEIFDRRIPQTQR